MSAYLKRLDITNIEEGTSSGMYVKYVDIVEVVDQDGNPWEPVPGPDPWDDLVVADKATWSGANVYAVGETISGVSATYTGGTDQTIYRSRVQHKSATDTDWNNSPWTNHINTPQVIQFTIPAGEENGSVRFQTQARDTGVDPVDQVNSSASVKGIAPLEWGTISVSLDDVDFNWAGEAAYPIAANTPVQAVVSVTDPPSDISYEWSKRGTDDVLIGTPTNATTVLTFPEQGIFSVTATLKSNLTSEWTSAIVTFLVS